jgi:hypothetical protein
MEKTKKTTRRIIDHPFGYFSVPDKPKESTKEELVESIADYDLILAQVIREYNSDEKKIVLLEQKVEALKELLKEYVNNF